MARNPPSSERRTLLNRRRLARAAIVAKMRYWEALRAFELETTSGEEGEWPDRIKDDVISRIDDFAIPRGASREEETPRGRRIDFRDIIVCKA